MAEKKELLSPEEIIRIIEEAAKPHFKDPALMVFARNRTDVIKVSPINQLIFIEGDENTGVITIVFISLQFKVESILSVGSMICC